MPSLNSYSVLLNGKKQMLRTISTDDLEISFLSISNKGK